LTIRLHKTFLKLLGYFYYHFCFSEGMWRYYNISIAKAMDSILNGVLLNINIYS